MKIAIFGGSFDPLHVGHVEIVNEALNYLNVDKLFIVPTYLNPLKKSSFASAHLRLNWIKKVFSSQNKITILDYEVKQNKPTASIKTVKFIKDNYSNIEKIYFIIGADNLSSLKNWHNYKELSNLVEFVVASRDEIKIPENLIKLPINAKISSSKLRSNMNKSFIPQIIEDEITKYYDKK